MDVLPQGGTGYPYGRLSLDWAMVSTGEGEGRWDLFPQHSPHHHPFPPYRADGNANGFKEVIRD